MSEILFCIHISGTDDLIPVRDLAEAVRASAYLNSEYLYMHEEIRKDKERPELYPYCFAAPGVWPYDAESHAKSMESRIARSKKESCPHWMVD